MLRISRYISKINGMGFKTCKKVIIKVGGFTLGGKNQCKKARLNDETSLWKLFKFNEELVQIHGWFSREDLPKP